MKEYPIGEVLGLAAAIQDESSKKGLSGQYPPGDVLTVAAMLVIVAREAATPDPAPVKAKPA